MAGLTHPELHDLVSEEAFRDRVLEVSELTQDDTLERGFAVYRGREDDIILSEVQQPDEEYQEAIRIYEEQRARLPERGLKRLLQLPMHEFHEVLEQYRREAGGLPVPQSFRRFLRLILSGDKL